MTKPLNKWVPEAKRGPPRPRVVEEPLEQGFVDVTKCPIIEPQYIIQDLLPTGLVLMQGPPKEAYKSLQTIICACLVARWNCQAFPQWARSNVWGPTMVWPMEAQPGELNWLIRHALRIEPEENTIWAALNPWEYKLDADDKCEMMLAWLRGHRPRLVILDPFRNMWGGDENDSGAIVAALQPLQDWAKLNTACILLVHHVVKPGAEKNMSSMYAGRGSSALPGLADGILTIEPGNQQGRMTLNAVFKRGPSYRRTIDLGVPGYGWGERGREVLLPASAKLLQELHTGSSFAEAANGLSLNGFQARECLDQLTRNGLWQDSE